MEFQVFPWNFRKKSRKNQEKCAFSDFLCYTIIIMDINETALLTPVECRILSALAEKSITVKDQYPLTFNSLMLACNQKSSRDPVMSLDVQTLGRGIESLIEKGLVKKHLFSGERSLKYTHCMDVLLDTLDPKATAIAIVLMLRGPQTAAELKTRTERLYQFRDTAETEAFLQQLVAREKPFVAKAPRRPGQKDGRYTHLFCGMPEAADEEQPVREKAVFLDRTEARLQLIEEKVKAIEEWLKDFSDGTFVPYNRPYAPSENAEGASCSDKSAEMVSSESVAAGGVSDGNNVCHDGSATASEASVSRKNSSEQNEANAETSQHDAPPGEAA